MLILAVFDTRLSAARINELNPKEEIVVHCKMGGQCAKAYDAMKKAGFTKIVKWQMFGRANLDLLKARVLKAA